ncbi:MAG: hypothetical protein IIT58_01800 [Treponema sp.]|nr:hypothetical protein [Treponema sp.]
MISLRFNLSKKKRGLLGWIIYFAGNKKGAYIVSILFALLSVACCIAPYFMIARIVRQLMDGMRDCIWPFAIAIIITPSLILTLLPIGGIMFLYGTISASLFITVIILALSA